MIKCIVTEIEIEKLIYTYNALHSSLRRICRIQFYVSGNTSLCGLNSVRRYPRSV